MSNNYYFNNNGVTAQLTEPAVTDTAVTVTSSVTFQNKTIEGGASGNNVAIDRIPTGGSPVMINSTPPGPGQTLITTGATNAGWGSLLTTTFFGTGIDADPNIGNGASVTLARDMYYDNLTIAAGGTLFTNGYRIFVKGTSTINGTISRVGSDASGTIGGPYLTGATLGDGGGGASGTGFPNNPNRTFSAGGTGGNGTSTSGGFDPFNPISADLGGASVFNDVFCALRGTVLNGTKGNGGNGGMPGGTGPGAGTNGGGGGGGGVILLSTNLITGSGTITAQGGAGGNAVGDGYAGGGGGGGGVIALVTSVNDFTGSLNVSGGTGGTGVNGGQNGSVGGTGGLFVITR